MKNEYEALEKNNNWEYVDKPKHRNILNIKWVFKLKNNENENIKYKTRLVVRDFAQTKGIDYEETYSLVVKYNSIRYFISIAAEKNRTIHYIDVNTAYLNSDLDEDIYALTPKEMTNPNENKKVWKLRKVCMG